MANENMFLAGTDNDNYWHESFGGGTGYYIIGHATGPSYLDGCLRFPGVTGTGNCAEARLYIHCDDRSGGAGNLDFNVWGMDENNTAPLNVGGAPTGRSKTTATINWEEGTMPVEGTFVPAKNVTSIVNEIRNRGGWNSGNALGFIFNPTTDNANDSWITGGPADVVASSITHLMIRESSNPNFNPTDKTVVAPSFPSADDYGVKISYPGYSVLTANESQLYSTTKKRTHKIIAEGKINTTANVTYNIAHGKAYIPFAHAYAKSSGTGRFKIPRYFPIGGQTDPFGDNIQGTVEVDSTNLKITTTTNAEVYYRIFIDELE